MSLNIILDLIVHTISQILFVLFFPMLCTSEPLQNYPKKPWNYATSKIGMQNLQKDTRCIRCEEPAR